MGPEAWAAEPPDNPLSRYTGVVHSVADHLREQTRAGVARLEPMARVRLALDLGDADAHAVARSKGISVSDARRVLAAARSVGRIASVANARTVR